jgi:tetratricopeptide (TPR) repeat protein
MPKYNSLIALLLSVMLVACESAPKPGIEPAPSASAATSDADAPAAEVSVDATQTGEEAGDDSGETAPTEPVDANQLAYEAAVETLKAGATDAALDELQRLSEITPNQPRLFTNLGLAHYQLEQFDAAEQAFREAILRDSADAVAYNHLGILQRRKGQFEEALMAYQRAIEIDVKYAHAHLNLGILFDLYLQDLEKALQQYRVYQSLTDEQNKQVAGWILDIERRLKADG